MKRTGLLWLLVMPSLAAVAILPELADAQASRAIEPSRADATHGGVTELDLAFDAVEGRPGAQVELTIRPRDPAGRARDASLRVETDGGIVDAPVRVSAGVYVVRIVLPTALGRRQSLRASVTADEAAASVVLPLVSGPPASLELALRVAVQGDLPADGASHPLWIGVSDAYGNPAREAPRASAHRGTVGAPLAIGPGEWLVDYRPPRAPWKGEDVIRVDAGEATASETLRLAPVRASLTVAPKAGLVVGAGGPALAVGAEAATWRFVGPAELGLVAGVAWWSARDSTAVRMADRSLDVSSRRTWLPLTLSLASRRPLGARGTLTFSLGGGGALVTSRADLAGQPEISESGWAPAVVAGLEVAFRTRLGAPFAELRGAWLGDPHLDAVRGAAWPAMLFLGSRFDAF